MSNQVLVPVLFTGFVALLGLLMALRPEFTAARGGKIFAFVALCILPVLSVWAGRSLPTRRPSSKSAPSPRSSPESCWLGQSKPEKIKFFFQQARIPLWERGNWPIITYNGIIVWAGRFGAAAEYATGPETRSVLQVVLTQPQPTEPRP